MRLFFRGVLRLLLAAALGLLVATPVRWLMQPAASAEASDTSATSPAKAQPAADVAPSRASGESDLPPYPTGFVIRGTKAVVRMSDGTIRYEDLTRPAVSDGIGVITPAGVEINGDRLYFKPAPRADASSPVFEPQQPATVPQSANVRPSADDGKSAWRLDPDGVYRLRSSGTLANTYAPSR